VDNGGTLVQHGTTHQYDELTNPYSAVSTDDFEFIRSWCTATPDRDAEAVPCTKTSYVQIGGELADMSAAQTADRVTRGRGLFAEAGLPTPTIFEAPHYAATDAAYQGISQVYSTRYERSLFYAGTLTGQSGGPYDYVGQFFPYTVTDPYGMNVLPENLGNYEPEAYSQHPARTAQDIVAAAQANTVVTHANASFFFHPFYDINALKDIVAGIKGAGYTFVPATDLG
ncbi:MAG: Tat pathway signal protein, partial [Actinomyces sp.]